MELYIIRHAQSTNNAHGKMEGRATDPHLTKLGKKQAEIIANHLADGINPETKKRLVGDNLSSIQRGYGITQLYCSPMERSLQTTQPIAKALGLCPKLWVDIHEHGGIYLYQGEDKDMVGRPGKTRSEILAEYPDYHLPDNITEEGWWFGGYENLATAYKRAIQVADKLRQQAESDERIALITHGGFTDSLIKTLLGQLPSQYFYFYFYNSSITRLDFLQDNVIRLRYINRVAHLPLELIS